MTGEQPREPQRESRPSARRDETADERADRNYDELLQELRVSQTGVQILFAFLLTIPFQQRFDQTVNTELRWVYLATLLTAAAATAFLIAPVSHHRVLFHQGRKPHLVAMANRLAMGGLVCLALSMIGAVYLVVSVVSAHDTAAWYAGVLALLFLLFWLLQPLRHRVRRRRAG